jgi:hypothetical protein
LGNIEAVHELKLSAAAAGLSSGTPGEISEFQSYLRRENGHADQGRVCDARSCRMASWGIAYLSLCSELLEGLLTLLNESMMRCLG